MEPMSSKCKRRPVWLIVLISVSFVLLLLFLVRASLLFVLSYPHRQPDVLIHGHYDRAFASVVERFRANFADGLERSGASLALYHRSRLVADVWAGKADTDREWKRDTATLLFSASKAVAALSIAHLVDRRVIDFQTPLVDFWPEFGRHSKNGTTVWHVLHHQSGLPYFERDLRVSDFRNRLAARRLARQRPAWTPGTATGYHPITFGPLLDEIVRRVDGRSLADYFREEIAIPHDVEVSLGWPNRHTWHERVARLSDTSFAEILHDLLLRPLEVAASQLLDKLQPENSPIRRAARFPSWMSVQNLNKWYYGGSTALPSVTGIATARGLATLFQRLIDGSILKNSTLVSALREPVINSWHLEKVVLWPVMKGHGFFYDTHPHIPHAYTFGHAGWGCQTLLVDPHTETVLVYLTNGLKAGTGVACVTATRIIDSVYSIV